MRVEGGGEGGRGEEDSLCLVNHQVNSEPSEANTELRPCRLQNCRYRQFRRFSRISSRIPNRSIWFLILNCLALIVPASTVIRYDGDVNIGVLVDLHEDGGVDDSERTCGQINMEAVQQVLAAKWAIEVINNQSLPHELNIGLQIQDTCSNRLIGQDQIFKIIRSVQEDNTEYKNLIGLIGVGSADYLLTAGAALNAFHVPVVAVDPDIYTKTGDHTMSNILTTAPDLAGQARALANLGLEIGTKKMALISSSQQSVASFLAESTTLGIRVPEILELVPRQVNIGPAVEGFLRSIPRVHPVVAVVLDPGDVVAVAEHLKHTDLPSQPTWLIGSLGLELHRLKSWRQVFAGGVFVEPHMPELREFKQYFLSAIKNPDSRLASLVEEYMAENTGCVPASRGTSSSRNKLFSRNILTMPDQGLVFPSLQKGVLCSEIPNSEMELRFQQDPKVSFVVKAVSALTAAFRLVQLDACGQDIQTSCLRTVRPGLHQDILQNLHKLSFTSMSGIQEVEGTRHHFTKSGRLVANKQILYSIHDQAGILPVGWYSEDDGLNIKSDVLPEPVPDTTTPTQEGSTAPRSSPLVNSGGRGPYSRSIQSGEDTTLQPSEPQPQPVIIPSIEDYLGRSWSLAVLSLCLLGVLLSLWMLVYVNLKLCDGTLSGNQSMGLLLLLGNLLVFGSSVPWVLPPSQSVCGVRHFMHPLALCLVFGLLLIKVMQLRSLVSVGLGGKIPQVNQMLSLFFMVMVQVVIASEWYVINMPLEVRATQGYAHCDVSKETFLLLHVYPSLLLLLAFVYALSVFKIKRNYNEGRWVLCATCLIIPTFLAWALVYYFGSPEYEDPAVAIALIIIGVVILSTIFLPKMHTISQQSKFRKLKLLQSGSSESTVYTTYNDYPGGMFYPVPGAYVPPSRYGRSQSKYKSRMNPPPPPPTGYSYRFNGLNYLSGPSAAAHTASYVDWSREHSPGHYHHASNLNNPYKRVSIKSAAVVGSNRKSKTPDTTLQKPVKRCSRTPESRTGRKSSKHNKDGLLLVPNGLPRSTPLYDKNARVYHITP